ncbi:hypothetical protein FPQ18DRAFT_382076, partial [Pyronema domesticum]
MLPKLLLLFPIAFLSTAVFALPPPALDNQPLPPGTPTSPTLEELYKSPLEILTLPLGKSLDDLESSGQDLSQYITTVTVGVTENTENTAGTGKRDTNWDEQVSEVNCGLGEGETVPYQDADRVIKRLQLRNQEWCCPRPGSRDLCTVTGRQGQAKASWCTWEFQQQPCIRCGKMGGILGYKVLPSCMRNGRVAGWAKLKGVENAVSL